jgi:outer membrane protein insertion porin family
LKHFLLYRICLLLFICLPFAVVAQLEPEIRKVKFKGNDFFSNRDLSRQISFSGSTWLGQKILRRERTFYSPDAWEMNVRELQHFYQSEGFMHFRLEPPLIKERRRGRKVQLTFLINEGPPVIIDTVIFHGPVEDLNVRARRHLERRKTSLKVKQGERFRDDFVWADQDLINKRIVDNGYAYAEVTPVIVADTTENKAQVIWELKPGPLSYFGEISVTGHKRTPERIIRKQILFEPGDLYSREKLSRSQQQIYQLGTFRIATMRAQLTRDRADTIPVSVTITEAPRTSTKVGVGYGREDKFRTFVDFQVRNFTGGVRRLNLYAKHSALEPYRIEATLTQPAAFSPNSTLTLSPYIKKQKEPGFEIFSYAATLSLLQRINDKTSGSVSLYSETVKLDTTSVALLEDGRLFNQSYTKSGTALGILFDNSRPRFNPSTGWIAALNTKVNTRLFNGNYPFLKYQFEVKNFQEVNDYIIVASKLKAGTIHTVSGNRIIPVEERFFAGGSRSVRGWARQQLGPSDATGTPAGGNSMVELSLEPRVNVIGPFGFVIFLDAGNVWTEYNDFSFSEIRLAAGFGVRFTTPIGPVGLDLARPIWDEDSRWQLHLNIGHAF